MTHALVRLTTVVLLCLMVPAGLLTACGEESARDRAEPLGEHSENDVPLDPPTLRFHVSATGQVGASPELEAEAGEVVALTLENDSGSDYELHLVGPGGDDVFAMNAAAGTREGGRAMPREPGTHVVAVYPEGQPDVAQEFALEVTET